MSNETTVSRFSRELKDQLRSLALILGNHPTPGMLWHFMRGQLERVSLHSRFAAPEVEAVRVRFRGLMFDRRFTQDWFLHHIPRWTVELAPWREQGPGLRILEIGSHEGRSALFFLHHFPGSRVTAIDRWESDLFHSAEAIAAVERRFDHNLAEFGDRVTKMRGESTECLARLAVCAEARFDLVYIDGSHYADDVMTDAVLAWRLLRIGGAMIFDDYLWQAPELPYSKRPCRAINLFVRLIKGEHRIQHVGYQVILVKTKAARK